MTEPTRSSFLRNVVLKRLATAAVAVSFVGLAATGLAMALGRGGGLVGTVHLALGIAFVLAATLHLVRNGGALKKLLARRPMQLALGLVTAGVVVVLVVGGGTQRRTRPPGAPGASAANGWAAQVQSPAEK